MNINEDVFAEGLRGIISRGIKNAGNTAANMGDKFLMRAVGDKRAEGRWDHRTATKQLRDEWEIFVGRKVRLGDTQIGERPTLGNLMQFLKIRFGIELSSEQLKAIAKSAVKETFKASSSEKSYLARLKSVINEADDLMNTVFDPDKLFPRLADAFMDAGLLQKRGNHAVENDPDEKKDAEDYTKLTAERHYIDINIMTEYLASNGISGTEMKELKQLARRGISGLRSMNTDSREFKVICMVAFATLKSIQGNRAKSGEQIQNITPSGHTINLRTFKEGIKHRIVGEDIKRLKEMSQDEISENLTEGTSYGEKLLILVIAVSSAIEDKQKPNV